MSLSAFCYALGYLTGLAVFAAMARRRGIATSGVFVVMAAGLIGGLAGANVVQWVVGGQPGKTVLGAIVLGYLSVLLAKRFLGLRRPLGDLFAVALCAGEAVGRFGCFFGGCCYGKPTHCAWAVWQHGEIRHPTQIYLSLASLAILIALWRYSRVDPPENCLFYLQGALYCIARFVIEFFRETNTLAIGLSTAQWACLAGFLFFAIRLHGLNHLPQVNRDAVPELQ